MPPQAESQGTPWATHWIEDAQASLPEAPPHERPACAARLAAMLFACGHDEAGETVLSAARRDAARTDDRAGMARIEIALADCAVALDNDARAHGHLAAARRFLPLPPSVASRAWLVDTRLALVEGRPAPAWRGDDPEATQEELVDPSERIDLGAELSLERAVAARLAGDWAAVRMHLERARELANTTSSPRLIALVDVEIGLYTAEVDDPRAGYVRIRNAIALLGASGLKRDEGRAMIRLAEMMTAKRLDSGEGAGAGTAEETAAHWLGRAKAVLGEAATWRDRSAIGTGFRAQGRRLVDRVMTEETAASIEGFERARGALLSGISVAVEAAEEALNDLEATVAHIPSPEPVLGLVDRLRGATLALSSSIVPAVGEVDRVVHNLIDLVGAALVERDRLRSLLGALSDIDATADRDALPPLVAQLAARVLEADHVVVALAALAKGGELEPVGRWGDAPSGSSDLWRTAASAGMTEHTATGTAPTIARRGDAQPAGPVLVVPMRAGEVEGVLYADKLARSGQFREQDHALAFLLAEYGALALGRLRAREREQVSLGRLKVTLDAIRDGVIAWDHEGVILSANASIERMLRIGRDELVGARADEVKLLAPLWSAVAATPRLDGSVVRIASGDFVVSTRPLGAADDPRAGLVITLSELERAQRIAQRIGGTRARYELTDLVGSSPALLRALVVARQAAASDSNVLLTGEAGTGKEVVAQAIHTASARAAEPFLGLHVAALPRDLLEAELFGYETAGERAGGEGGEARSAREGSAGKLELAGAGTLLLDEVGEMPLDLQAKLLRVLKERVVVRLGGTSERPVHARVMATSRRDLVQLVEDGKFRMDLLSRLRVLSIELPPLRERTDDIAVLARHYLLRFAEQQRKRVVEIAPAVLAELARYDWPGNVRELANAIESEVSVLPADATVLGRLATRIAGRFRPSSSTAPASTDEPAPFSSRSPIVPLLELEKRAYLHALEKSNQNVARAAEGLGVSKVTFYAKLRTWGMHPRDRFDDEGPTSVRRSRVSSSGAEPFEPPTRTSSTKMPTDK